MRQRAKELYEKGLACFQGEPSTSDEDLVLAIAVMLDTALPAPRRKTHTKSSSPLPFSPQELHKLMLASCHPELVICEPYKSTDFGILGRNLKQVSGLELADMERLVAWIQGGGMKGWSVQPTWSHICRGVDKYISWAREWERRGQQTNPRGAVGSVEVASDIDLSGAFD